MNIIILNGLSMTTEQSAHQEIKKKLNFPSYYGENYHALVDCLSDLAGEGLHIVWIEYRAVFSALNRKAEDILNAFYTAYSYYKNERVYKFTVLDGPLSDIKDIIPIIKNIKLQ